MASRGPVIHSSNGEGFVRDSCDLLEGGLVAELVGYEGGLRDSSLRSGRALRARLATRYTASRCRHEC